MHNPPNESPKTSRAENQRPSKAKGWIIAGACVVAAGGAYFGSAAWISSQLPANAAVAGVSIGSMSPDQAREVLADQVTAKASEPIKVQVDGQDYTLDPAKAGLSFDVDATLEGLTQYEVNPVKLYERLTGSYAIDPAVNVDQDKLDAALKSLAKKTDAKVAEGTIKFTEGQAKLTEPVAGVELDQPQAAETLQEQWDFSGATIELPAHRVDPKFSAEQLKGFYDGEVTKLLSAPVTLQSGDKKVEVSPESIAAAASVVLSKDAPSLSLDDEKLAKAATKNSDFSSTAKNAKVVLKGGKPSIVESKEGIALETKDLGQKVLEAAATDSRTATVELVAKDAEFTTADAKKLGIKEEIVHFSTPYPTSDTVRTKNLKAGSKRLNGLVIKPGETFSLLKALGPITTANGYYGSGVVVDGFSSEAVGGGLSQISTQMYNAGFLAGYDDITHKPHSRWFERYPAGREATLWEGQVDMQWKNNTPYGVLIEAWVSSDRVHTRLWSTKYWKVSQDSSGKHHLTKPETKYNPADQCVPERGGKPGFTIDITRYREAIDGSKKLPAETKTWTYQPWHKVVCGTKP